MITFVCMQPTFGALLALAFASCRSLPATDREPLPQPAIFGVGVALATKFGRREPWFLAWRPIEA